ncbi:hypothetical protein [Streptomyces albidoflavus]|uniref:hypothetical protein n=1 Tax=Streptomyces albidoflavus TaxID=1886 RepID=UPI003EBEC559
MARLVQLAPLELGAGEPEGVERAAPVVAVLLTTEGVGDERLGEFRVAEPAVCDTGVDGEFRLVEVRHPGRVGIACADPAEGRVRLREGAVGRRPVSEGRMGERLPRGEHGQNPGRRSFRVPDLVPGRRNQSEGVSRPFLVRGLQAHAGEDVGQ